MFLKPFKSSKYNFTIDFFEKRQLMPFYRGLINQMNSEEFSNSEFNISDPVGKKIHEVQKIPSYLSLILNKSDVRDQVIKYNKIEHFLINLEGFSNVSEFLNSFMKLKNSNKVRNRKKRLETCFKIEYRSYFGDISESEYNFLFQELKHLVGRRFEQRGDKFAAENKWNSLFKETYQLILDKKASFYVIYNEEKPIHIGLNYHFQNIVIDFISSYDIDYYKFGLGQIAIFAKIEWCFDNNFKIFDLMWGGVKENKLFWCNDIRTYENQFVYKDNHILKTPYVKFLLKKDKLKDRIFQMYDSSETVKKIYRNFKKRFTNKNENNELQFQIDSIEQMPLNDSINKISIKSNENSFLRKPVYDFQYQNFEPYNIISVYKDNINENLYFVKGSKSQIKVLVNHK